MNFLSVTGLVSQLLLLACIACSAYYTWTGHKRQLKWRKPLGMASFWACALHFAGYVYLWDFKLAIAPVLGLLALGLMVSFAVTSNKPSMKRLGRRWKKLHVLIYLATILVAGHIITLSPESYHLNGNGIVFGAIVLLIVFTRVPSIRAKIKKHTHEKATAPSHSRRPGIHSVGPD